LVRASETFALVHALNDPYVKAEMAFSFARGRLNGMGQPGAEPLLLEAQAVFRDRGDTWYLGQVQMDLGMVALLRGDDVAARRSFAKALAAAVALKDRVLEALAYNNLGEVARMTGDDVEAAAQYGRSPRLNRDMGIRTEIPRLVHNQGYLALHAGDAARARACFVDSLDQFRAIKTYRGMVEAVAGLAAVAAQLRVSEGALHAACLWAATDAIHAASETRVWPPDRVERDRYEAQARSVVDRAAFDTAYAAGQALSLDEAIAQALGRPESAPPAPGQ
jgi:hypothetical protein